MFLELCVWWISLKCLVHIRRSDFEIFQLLEDSKFDDILGEKKDSGNGINQII